MVCDVGVVSRSWLLRPKRASACACTCRRTLLAPRNVTDVMNTCASTQGVHMSDLLLACVCQRCCLCVADAFGVVSVWWWCAVGVRWRRRLRRRRLSLCHSAAPAASSSSAPVTSATAAHLRTDSTPDAALLNA